MFLTDVQQRMASPRSQAMIKTLRDNLDWIEKLNFEQRENLESLQHIRGKLPATNFRDYNREYDETPSQQESPILTSLKPMGHFFSLDKKLIKVRTRQGVDIVFDEVQTRLESMGRDMKKFFVGNQRKANQPQGAYHWIDYYDKPTNRVKRPLLSASAQTLTGAGSVALINAMRAMVQRIRPDFILMNEDSQREIEAMTQTTDSSALANFYGWDWIEMNGEKHYVGMWDKKIPIFDFGTDSADNFVMPYTETWQGDNETSSVLFVRSKKNGKGMNVLVDNLQNWPEFVVDSEKLKNNYFLDGSTAFEPNAQNAVGRLFGIKKNPDFSDQ